MAYQKEEVDGFGSIDSVNKPLFLGQVRSRDDLGIVGVAGKIVEDSKCHDSQSEGRREIAILIANILELLGGVVQDLHIRSHIFFAVVLTGLCECFVGNVSQVQLMVADRQEVIVDLLEDDVGDIPVGRRGVRKACAIVKVTYDG